MTNIVKNVDSFEGWEDGVEGNDRPEGAGIIQGNVVKFTNEAAWTTRDGNKLPTDLELVAVDVVRVVQKWFDQQPVETIILKPHEKFPDLEKKNEETPREEWGEDPNGNPCGPWQSQHILYLLDLSTMDKYTYPTGTAGGTIAIRELRDKIVWMKTYRGTNVYPVVVPSDTFFPTRFGGRQRPHFQIVRWVRFGGEGGEGAQALPSPSAPSSTVTPDTPDTPSVPEPSLKEELNDDIPDFENEEVKDTKAASPPPPAKRDLKKKPAKSGVKAASKKDPTNLLNAG
jgi:hypothetical protein